MPETWIDDALGSGFSPDERFTSRLETTLRDEWRTETPTVALSSTTDLGRRMSSPGGESPSRDRSLLVAAAALLLAAGGVVSWRLTTGGDESPATVPRTTSPDTVATSLPSGDVIDVPAEGGSSLDIRQSVALESIDGQSTPAVTASADQVYVLTENEEGKPVVQEIVPPFTQLARQVPIEVPAAEPGTFTLHADTAGADLYSSWVDARGQKTTVARYVREENDGFVIAAQRPADFGPDSDIFADRRGLLIDGRLALRAPGAAGDTPSVRILDDDGKPWLPPELAQAPAGQRLDPEIITVEMELVEGDPRSTRLRLEGPADGRSILGAVARTIEGTSDTALFVSYVQQGELRTNIVRIRADGSVSIGFIRGWYVAGFDDDRLTLWGLHPSGVRLATAPWPS